MCARRGPTGCSRPAPSYRIGRDPESDIVVEDPRVSWHHAVLRLERDFWLLEDSGSTNGTFVGADRVRQVPITGNCLVRLGHPEDGPPVSCSLGRSPAGRGNTAVADPPSAAPAAPPAAPPVTPSPAYQVSPPAQAPPAQARSAQAPPPGPARPDPPARPPAPTPRAQPPSDPWPGLKNVPESQVLQRPPSAVMRVTTTVLRIGRAADNDVVVSDLSVSRYHAQLRRTTRGSFEIVDLEQPQRHLPQRPADQRRPGHRG